MIQEDYVYEVIKLYPELIEEGLTDLKRKVRIQDENTNRLLAEIDVVAKDKLGRSVCIELSRDVGPHQIEQMQNRLRINLWDRYIMVGRFSGLTFIKRLDDLGVEYIEMHPLLDVARQITEYRYELLDYSSIMKEMEQYVNRFRRMKDAIDKLITREKILTNLMDWILSKELEKRDINIKLPIIEKIKKSQLSKDESIVVSCKKYNDIGSCDGCRVKDCGLRDRLGKEIATKAIRGYRL